MKVITSVSSKILRYGFNETRLPAENRVCRSSSKSYKDSRNTRRISLFQILTILGIIFEIVNLELIV